MDLSSESLCFSFLVSNVLFISFRLFFTSDTIFLLIESFFSVLVSLLNLVMSSLNFVVLVYGRAIPLHRTLSNSWSYFLIVMPAVGSMLPHLMGRGQGHY